MPGIDPAQLRAALPAQQGGILGMFNMFSGGALSRFSIFALGIMPYISASIIMQLMTVVVPTLEALKKEGESGRRKITQYTRYGTLGPGAVPVARHRHRARRLAAGLVIDPGFGFRLTAMVTLITGTMFLMWLGEQITERGIGNGISMIIFAGIAAGLPQRDRRHVRAGAHRRDVDRRRALHHRCWWSLVTFASCFVERGQRKILVNYAKRQVGNKVYGGQTSHLPLKLNMSGVIPPIFASSIILFPATLGRLVRDRRRPALAAGPGRRCCRPGQPIYVMLYAAAIIFFCFFYTALVFNTARPPTT